MKRKLKLVVGAICLMAAFCWENHKKNEMSTLSLENIEALASGEEESLVRCYGSGSVDCYGYWVEMKIIF